MKQFSVHFFVLCALLISSVVHAKSPVWQITKGDDSLYLGGTIHLLSKSDYPLPESFYKAYLAADDVVLEVDTLGLFAPEMAQRTLNVMTYQDHRALSNVLPRDMLDEFTRLLESKGIPLAAFDQLTPAGAVLTLINMELARLGATADMGVDLHFNKLASDDNKELIYLETAEQQLGFLASLDSINPEDLIASGIRDINQLESKWNELLEAWKTGDLDSLKKLGIEQMKRDFPSVYQTMMLKRNIAWLEDIETMIDSADVEFILVGAMHLAGDDGLIQRLKKRGFKVTQLD